ncbi:methyltransferase [Cnuibacter physcomitrellae]|uniref:methyltransferase n=1 Tax=Cnuibacter physcomitrellae TaxID=1619308 RepID=UPI002175996A|nr:methyltransferase [Cnuibacter physcomitrellae]MCS5497680.1 methyltransferase [Cnuibacter physcomitrellae]
MTSLEWDLLRRWPDVEAPELVAVDAADRLILDEAADAGLLSTGRRVSVIGDDYGALTLGAVTAQGLGAGVIRVHQDALSGERALAANAARAGVDPAGFRSYPSLSPEVVEGADVVLLKLPRSLEALDDIARLIARHADPEVRVIAGGRLKHMSHSMNDVLGRDFETVEASLARQKARVLRASGPRPGVTAAGHQRARIEEAGLWNCAVGGVFSGARLDIGTRVLLDRMRDIAAATAPSSTVVDLGCGTGLLAVAAARALPDARVIATDQSAAAVASAGLTAEANGMADRIEVLRADAGDALADASADLVLLNPPFHVGGTVHTAIASKLFAAAARILAPGGRLVAVWNSGLGYRRELERVVGPTAQLARTPKFTLTESLRR